MTENNVIEETKKAIEDEEEEEKNSGVVFPGKSLESCASFKLDDIEVSIKDIVVVEIYDEQLSEFTFYYKPIKILAHGKCEYCYTYKPLTCQCKCKEVKYCTDECMKKDEKFHMDKCKIAYQVDKDFKL